jgi:glycosyltransferase involved in cell wall biosynthesis
MTDPTPLVSVIVPCWNAAASIPRSLASVLQARDVPVECVVVDDASSDGCADVVQAIADNDPRVVLVRAPANRGVSVARNIALDIVRGEWLTFLDADDRMMPGGLTAMVSAGRSTDALAVVGQRVLSDGDRIWIPKLYEKPDIQEPGRKSLVQNPGLMSAASVTGKLFHRTITTGLRFKGRVLGDQPWAICALLRASDRIEVIGETVYEWTRPSPTHQFVSITASKRESAALAADAVDVAVGALREVSDEARRLLPEAAQSHSIAVHYFDRLVRGDFSGPIERALESRDPGTARLFSALAAFIAAAPPDIVAESTALTGRILTPPIRAWETLVAPARGDYWSMVRAVPGSDRVVAARVGISRPGRLAVRLVRRLPGALGPAAATGTMVIGRRARDARRWIRRDRASG